MTVALRLRDVRKVFKTRRSERAGLKTCIVRPQTWIRRGRGPDFVAIDRVSLDVERGESLGIVGRNGAGKTTLLALMAGVLRPTSGTVTCQGRRFPLLGLGLGFAPDLTGRENIALNGVLLGIPLRETKALQGEILEFSGLEEFADQPLRTYSSGMQARLGFAIAVSTRPEILLVDEALAVGDAGFRDRCIERMLDFRRQGTTLICVAHDLDLLEQICERALLMDRGRVLACGGISGILERYRGLISCSADAGAPGAQAGREAGTIDRRIDHPVPVQDAPPQ